MAVAGELDCRRRSVSDVAIYGTVAMIHRANKHPRALLLLLAPAVLGPSNTVARLRLRGRVLLEEFLLLLSPAALLRAAVHLLGSAVLRWLLLGLGLLRGLHLLRLALHSALLVRLVLAAAPTAPMPLRLPLIVGWGWPQLRLGRRQFYCHACTSWHFAM